MINLKQITLFLILILAFQMLKSQNQDFQSWNSLSVKSSIYKKISFTAEYESRFNNNASNLDKQSISLSGRYKLNKILAIKIGYRNQLSKDIKKGNSYEHRFFSDLNINYSLNNFKFTIRERYQSEYSNQFSDEFSYYIFHHLRHRLTLAYNFDKTPIETYLEAEIYQGLNNPIANGFEKTRLTSGINYTFSKHFDIELFYRYQTKSNYISKNQQVYIVGTALKIKI